MSKKDEKKDTRHVEALIDALLPAVEQLSPEEIDALLAESGSDLRKLRKALHAMATETAAAHRRGGHAAPKALTAFAEAMDDQPTLPTDPREAEAKAISWIRGLGEAFRLPANELRVREAYRKGDKELTARDRELLDDAAAKLRKKLEDDGTK